MATPCTTCTSTTSAGSSATPPRPGGPRASLFFDRLRFHNPTWQRGELGFSARDVADARRQHHHGLLAMLRMTIGLIRFEHLLYNERTATPAAAADSGRG
ncbi:MAG: hypothetical protein U0514_00585 [Candidatus Andersenbacteria bacterium]